MKYDKVKRMVAQGVYTTIIEGRDYKIMATILIDKLFGGNSGPVRHSESFKEYADFAWTVIENWDIRRVGRLRELFPQHFPFSLRKGQLICEYDEQGDWVVISI